MKITQSKQLSTLLKDIRRSRKQSQSVVADKVGIRQDTLSSFEQNPDATKLETLFKILSALDLELEVRPRNGSLATEESINLPTAEREWKEEW